MDEKPRLYTREDWSVHLVRATTHTSDWYCDSRSPPPKRRPRRSNQSISPSDQHLAQSGQGSGSWSVVSGQGHGQGRGQGLSKNSGKNQKFQE